MKKLLSLALSFALVFTMSVSTVIATTRGNEEVEVKVTGKLGDHIEYTLNKSTDVLYLSSVENVEEPSNFSLYNAILHSDIRDQMHYNIKEVDLSSNFCATKGMQDLNQFFSLEQIKVSEENEKYSSYQGILFDKTQTTVLFCPISWKYVTAEEPNGLTSFEIPDSAEAIGNEQFNSPFGEGYTLKKVIMGAGIKSISEDAFVSTGKNQIESYIVNDNNTVFKSQDGVLFSKNGEQLIDYPSGKMGDIYQIPNGVKVLEKQAFSNAKNLKSITLPDGLTTIKYQALGGIWSYDDEIVIPASVNNVENGAFRYNKGLSSVTFNENSQVQTIYSNTFQSCTKLSQIEFKMGSSIRELSLGDSNLAVLNLNHAELTTLNGNTSTNINSKVYLSIEGSSFNIKSCFNHINLNNISNIVGAKYNEETGEFENCKDGVPIQYTYDCEGTINGQPIKLQVELYLNDNIAISEKTFPDPGFRDYVATYYDIDKNGVFSPEERNNVSSINVRSEDIMSLKGIENFPNVQVIGLEGQNLEFNGKTALDFVDLKGLSRIRDISIWEGGSYKGIDLGNNVNAHITYKGGNWTNKDISELSSQNDIYINSNSFNFNDIAVGIDLTKIKNFSGADLDTETGKVTNIQAANIITYDYNCGSAIWNDNQTDIVLHVTLNIHRTSMPDIKIDSTNFDEEFMRVLLLSADKNRDGVLSPYEQMSTKGLNFRIYNKANTLKGIECFKELTKLNCEKNTELEDLDVSKNTNLQYLYCQNSKIDELKTSQLKNLKELDCSYTNVKNLSFVDGMPIEKLNCSNTLIKELNVHQLPYLEEVQCQNTKISKLEFTKCPLINTVICYNTDIKGFNMSKGTAKISEISAGVNLAWADLGNLSDEFKFNGETDKVIETNLTVDSDQLAETAPVAKLKVGFKAAAENSLSLDLKRAFEGIDVTKVTVSSGAVLDGNMLTGIEEGTPVTYTYDCGSGYTLNVTLNVSAPDIDEPGNSGGGNGEYIPPYIPPYEPPAVEDKAPTIEKNDGGSADFDGKTGTITITPEEGYVIKDVLLNGNSLGKVETIENVKDTDEVKVVFETIAQRDNRIRNGVKNTKIVLRSEPGKGYIRLKWTKSKGFKVDKFEIFRSLKKNTGYGKKAFYISKNGTQKTYKNTKSVKKGVRYYYKARGVRKVAGKNVYTKWSTKAWRTSK